MSFLARLAARAAGTANPPVGPLVRTPPSAPDEGLVEVHEERVVEVEH